MRVFRTAAAVSLAVLASTALVACGDDEESTKDSGAVAGAANTAPAADKPKGEPFRLGFVCSCTGVQKAIYSAGGDVMKAWEKDVNARGGINGHPVEVIVKDDGGDPAKAQRNVKELAQSGVMAIVSGMSLADAVVAKEAKRANLLVVGGTALPPYLSNPDWFPSGSSLVAMIFGAVQAAKDEGKKNIGAMYCAESPVCAQLVPLVQGIGQIVGVDVTPAKVSSTAPNYTAPCLAMKDKGADALFPALNGEVIRRVIAGCSQQGYKPLPLGYASVTTPDFLKDPAVDGSFVSGTNVNPFDSTSPGAKRYRAALEEHASGVPGSPEDTYLMFVIWSGGPLFEAAAEAGKLKPGATTDDLRAALYQLKNETLDGITAPLTFTKGQPTFTPCWFKAEIADGDLKSTQGDKPTCMTTEQATALGKALAG